MMQQPVELDELLTCSAPAKWILMRKEDKEIHLDELLDHIAQRVQAHEKMTTIVNRLVDKMI